MEYIFFTLLFLFGGVVGFIIAKIVQDLQAGNKEHGSALKPSDKLTGPLEDKEDIEIARLWRRTGRPGLEVEIDGQRYHSPKELDETQRNRLSMAKDDLSAWLYTSAPEAPATAVVELSSAPITIEPQAIAGYKTTTDINPRPISLNPFEIFVPGSHIKTSARLKSLAEQIDEVLQEKINSSSEQYPDIHLADSPGQGLLVIIGFEKFEGLEAVPDKNIQALIQEAIKEWEKRTTLKK